MVFEILVQFATAIIFKLGYAGVFVLMALESMLFPVPSEAVMPFAGFLVSQGSFSFWLVALISALGCLAGSLIGYAIGYFGATPLVHAYGKYLLIEEKHLRWTHTFFEKHGGLTVFVCRFIPLVRHVSSIPAGAGKMNLWKFSGYTLAGAFIWNTFLLWLGVKLGEHWAQVKQYTTWIDVFVLVAVVFAIVYVVQKLRAAHRKLR